MGADLITMATQALAVPVSAGILANGLDELHMDLQYFVRGLHKKERRAITPEQLAAAPRQRIAIMVAAWKEADVIESMKQGGFEPGNLTVAEADAFIRAEHKRWGEVIRAAGIQPQ